MRKPTRNLLRMMEHIVKRWWQRAHYRPEQHYMRGPRAHHNGPK